MSDIIYTPPASGGGGTTINSNNNFIPVRQNATTFVDSLLFSSTTILKSVFSGTDKGIIFDFLNSIFIYGNYNTGLFANTNNQEVYISSNANPYAYLDGINNIGFFGGAGARLNFNGVTNYCNLGDGNGNYNSTYLEVDDFNQIIQTNGTGLKLDFANNVYFLGDYNGVVNFTYASFDVNNKTIELSTNSTTSIFLDGVSDKQTFTTNDLSFQGAGLQSNTSSGNSGEHLVITLNGTQYKIKLELP